MSATRRAPATQHIADRQASFQQWLEGREGRLSELMARSFSIDVGESIVVGEHRLTEEELAELRNLVQDPQTLRDLYAELESKAALLGRILTGLDPFDVIARVAYYELIGPGANEYEPAATGLEVVVEVVASLVVQSGDVYGRTTTSSEFVRVLDLAQELHRLTKLSIDVDGATGEDYERVQVSAKSSWSTVRGSMYQVHGARVYESILSSISDEVERRLGFSPSAYSSLVSGYEKLLEARLNDSLSQARTHLQSTLQAGTNDVLSDSMLVEIDNSLSAFSRAQIVSIEGLAAEAGVCQEVVRAILEKVSLRLGADRPEYSGPTGDSALHSKPVLMRGEDVIVPVPGGLLRNPYEIIEPMLVSAWPGFERHRSLAVDRMAVDALSTCLGACIAEVNLFYGENGAKEQQYECDGVVLVGDICFVVESKAGRVHPSALRASDTRRLDRVIREIVDSAHVQCSRVRDYINDPSSDSIFYDGSGREVVRFVRGSIRQILFVNPTLHSLGTLPFEQPSIDSGRNQDGGPSHGELWTVGLGDLFVVCEMLDDPASLVDYLSWRASVDIGASWHVIDELDLLGTYMFGRFALPQVDQDVPFILGPSSTDFDEYYLGMHRGAEVDKPRALRQYLGPTVNAYYDDLVARRPRGWLLRCEDVLSIPFDEYGQIRSVLEAPLPYMAEPWMARICGLTLILVLNAGVNYLDVALDVAANVPPHRRKIIAHRSRESVRVARIVESK